MRNYLLTMMLVWMLPAASASQVSLKDLYHQIDDAIDHSPEYVSAYEAKIQDVKTAYWKESSAEKRLLLLQQLFDMYKAYANDSALVYIDKYIRQAEALGYSQMAKQGRVLMAFQCSTVGLYTESLGILHDIQSADLSQEGKVDYYRACMHVCGELGYYTQLPDMRTYYDRLQREFSDSLMMVAHPDSEDYLLRQETLAREAGKYEEALKLNNRRLEKVEEGTRDYAIVAYYRYLVYEGLQQPEEAKRWLAISGLTDVRQAVMDQAALLALAEKLNSEGDFDRSYRYIRFTWDCNNRFNTRMRAWQISPILTVIENNYQNEMRRNTQVLAGSVVLVSILALLLVGALFFLRRQNRKLSTARNELHAINEKLAALNNELSEANQHLDDSNRQLLTVNAKLSEANQVKEEYIGRFLSLCSGYIEKLDNYRKMVNKKMKNKELEELFRITKSTELKEKELEELNQNFDSVFLHLFPNFVDDFNAMLQPEVQIHPKDENRLTTDLRIFALIRLGIEDSSKIAEFLHYSVNTIYNYRARIKNGAIDNRGQFERKVKELGLPK